MSFEFPVTFDQDILSQYREELEFTNQEVEMLAINLEREPGDMATVEKIRDHIQEAWMSSVKLDLIPVSESLADTLKGLDLLLDWQVYPPAMTEFILGLLDRLMIIALEVEEKQFIDMRKTQAILVALQYIILAKDFNQINQGIEDAIVAINQEICGHADAPQGEAEVMLFDDGVDLFDDGIDLFEDSPEQIKSESVAKPEIDIFIPEAATNPLLQARDYIRGHSDDNCKVLLEQVAAHVVDHHSVHANFLLELSLTMNILAGNALEFESVYKGICMHDLALATMSGLMNKKSSLNQDEIDELRLHPLKSAELAHEFIKSEETELLVLHHHERMDGSGYPFGLQGNNISEHGKLAGIVDAFHDVINKHHESSERNKVLRGIVDINIGMGKLYDPAWVKLFNVAIRDYWLPDWRQLQREKSKKTG